MTHKVILPALLTSLIFATPFAAAKVDEAQNRELISIYTGNNSLQQKKTAERLTYWAVEDPQVYELIENLIQTNYLAASSRDEADYVSWLLKGLAASGDDKYVSTLSMVQENAKSSKVRKYAGEALDNLKKYKRWNPVINQEIDPDIDLKNFMGKNYFNMIGATDLELVRLGAKRITYEDIKSPVLAEAVNARILDLYGNAGDDLSVDTVAWLLKALSVSGGLQFRDTFTEVTTKAQNRKIRKYARKYEPKL